MLFLSFQLKPDTAILKEHGINLMIPLIIFAFLLKAIFWKQNVSPTNGCLPTGFHLYPFWFCSLLPMWIICSQSMLFLAPGSQEERNQSRLLGWVTRRWNLKALNIGCFSLTSIMKCAWMGNCMEPWRRISHRTSEKTIKKNKYIRSPEAESRDTCKKLLWILNNFWCRFTFQIYYSYLLSTLFF